MAVAFRRGSRLPTMKKIFLLQAVPRNPKPTYHHDALSTGAEGLGVRRRCAAFARTTETESRFAWHAESPQTSAVACTSTLRPKAAQRRRTPRRFAHLIASLLGLAM